uniref:Uncharacterized protein n=1 Tax=Borely moumouvirus TaxID=2712067 RepID=A0A6G6ACP4_9VIRU
MPTRRVVVFDDSDNSDDLNDYDSDDSNEYDSEYDSDDSDDFDLTVKTHNINFNFIKSRPFEKINLNNESNDSDDDIKNILNEMDKILKNHNFFKQKTEYKYVPLVNPKYHEFESQSCIFYNDLNKP